MLLFAVTSGQSCTGARTWVWPQAYAGAALSALAACAQPLETPPLPTPTVSDAGGPAIDATTAVDAGACVTGTAERCVCGVSDDGTPREGERSCAGAAFGPCRCGDAGAALVPQSDCKAGPYAGDVAGMYTTDLALLGLPGTVQAADTKQKALQFTLTAPTANDRIFSVLDGSFHGAVAGAFAMEGTFTGALNCDSKTFAGTLRGSYAVLGQRRTFEGPLTANYDPALAAFVQGTWDLAEIPASTAGGNSSGGKGSWGASGQATADAGLVSP